MRHVCEESQFCPAKCAMRKEWDSPERPRQHCQPHLLIKENGSAFLVDLFQWKCMILYIFLWPASSLLPTTSPERVFLWFASEQCSWFDSCYFPAGTCLGLLFPSAPVPPLLGSQAVLLGPRDPHTCPLGRKWSKQRDIKSQSLLAALDQLSLFFVFFYKVKSGLPQGNRFYEANQGKADLF